MKLTLSIFSLFLLLGAPLASAQDEKTLLPEPKEPAPVEEVVSEAPVLDSSDAAVPETDADDDGAGGGSCLYRK